MQCLVARRTRFVFFVMALAALPALLSAQSTELGTIAGTVTDPAGAAVPDANVKVIGEATNVTREVKTDSQGSFAARSLVPGTYRVEVSAPSFAQQVQGNIKLDVSATATLDFHLTVGQVNQQIEVQAQGALLQTEESSVGTLISNTQIMEMPLNGRNFNDLTRLTPGAVRGTSAGGETIQGETFAVAGDRSDNSYFSLDGMYNNGSFFKTAAIHPSIDAIQEFRIATNTGAQYGAAAGANINIMIKPGTNEYHGTVYEFLRNDKFDSRNYFAQNVPELRQNQFGFAIGGPVQIPKVYNGHDKTFWFFNYEGTRIRSGNTSFQTVPTAAMIGGDLSHDQSGAPAPQIYNPFSTRLDPATGNYVKDVFPGNIIPASLIKPYATAYANYWFPTTLISGQTSNYIDARNSAQDDDQINLRIDQRVSEKNNFYARFSKSNLSTNVPANLPKAFTGTYNDYVGAVLNDVHLFNPNTILNFRFGYLRANLGQGPTEHFISVYRQAGLTNTPETFRNFDYPINFGISGYAGPGLGNLVNGPDFTYQGSISLNKIIGKHSFTLGYDLTRLRIFHDSVFSNFGYTSTPTADPQNVNNTGQAFASFLLGLPSTASRIVGQDDLDLRQFLHHIYIQDDVKVSSKLTLNLGLRWEYDQWPHHIRGRLSGFDTITGQLFWVSTNPITGQAPNVRPQVADPRYSNFAPRVGFAYRITPTTTIRSSYGIFYNSNYSWEWSSSRGGWPYSVSDNLTGLNIAGTPIIPTENLFQSFNPASTVPQNQHTVARDLRTPYMQNWNFGVEHQFAQDVLLEMNYQGSKGTHLSSFLNSNDAPPGPGSPDPRREWPSAGAFSELKDIATSRYEALTAKLQKRFSNGFSILASYAWSHSIDLNSEFGGSSPQNDACIKCDLGDSGFDQRHVFNGSYIYIVPGASSQNRMIKYVLGGWEIAGITTLETGRAFNIGINFDNANNGARSNSQRPDLVGDPFPSGFTSTYGPGGRYFNTAAFAPAPQYHFGNLGRNALHGPAFHNTDIGAFKNFALTERFRLQFRAEFFNIFNNVNFSLPDRTLGDTNFGAITGTDTAQRQVQFALKVLF
ncbi:MAG: TonB-dependent receptor [Bryobacterales bacterium]|nr:TonB-dependent receptor [Bryobacterales bacterium]